TRGLHAVGVRVEPHPVAHRGRAAVAEVDVGPRRTRGEGKGRDVGRRDAVEVVGRGDARRQRRGNDADAVGSTHQMTELVVAVPGARGRADDVAATVEELDGGAVDANLTGVLNAVAVGVEPQPVAHRAGAAVAEVDVRAVLAGRQAEGGDVGRRDAVEVEGRR